MPGFEAKACLNVPPGGVEGITPLLAPLVCIKRHIMNIKEMQTLSLTRFFDIAAVPLLRTVRIELDAGSRLGGLYGNTLLGSNISSLARADVRVRVRPSVIRVRISETALRAVIRVAAPKQQLIPLYLPSAPVGVAPGTLPVHAFRSRSGCSGNRTDLRIFQFVIVLCSTCHCSHFSITLAGVMPLQP